MTLGHLDIIERSSRMVDELTVAVLKNNAKNPLFSADERVSMIKEFTSHLPNVTVTAYDGLLAEDRSNHYRTWIACGNRF